MTTLHSSQTLAQIYTALTTGDLGSFEWWNFEPETILSEEGIYGSGDNLPLLADKVNIVQIIKRSYEDQQYQDENADPSVLSDPLFLLHTSDVVNGEHADFDSVPSATSLEAIWTAASLKELVLAMGKPFNPSSALKAVITHSLVEDGFSFAPDQVAYVVGHQGLTDQAHADPFMKGLRLKAIDTYLTAASAGKI